MIISYAYYRILITSIYDTRTSYEVILIVTNFVLFNFRSLSLSIYMISPLFTHVYILYYIHEYIIYYELRTIYIIYIYHHIYLYTKRITVTKVLPYIIHIFHQLLHPIDHFHLLFFPRRKLFHPRYNLEHISSGY